MKDLILIAIVSIIAVILTILMLDVADQRGEYYNEISDCVWEEMEAQEFGGSLEQGWRLFAEGCKEL